MSEKLNFFKKMKQRILLFFSHLLEKKNNKKDSDAKRKFKSMTKNQKEDFLSNDLNERIIRVEQRVSTRFNKFIPYYKTEYYRSMTKEQKMKFKEYLENKEKKKVLLLALLLVPLIILSFLNFSFTGKTVSKELTELGMDINFIFVSVFLLFAIVLIIAFFIALKRKKKFNKHIRIIDNLFTK